MQTQGQIDFMLSQERHEKNLLEAIPPAPTASYSPLSHKFMLESIQEECDKKNLHIVQKKYSVAGNYNKMIAYFDIASGNNDLGIRLAVKNSYDKSMRWALCTGTVVWICSNGHIMGNMNATTLKHVGNSSASFYLDLDHQLEEVQKSFIQHEKSMNIMKDKTMTLEEYYKLFGMSVVNNLITPTQANLIVKDGRNAFKIEEEGEVVECLPLWEIYNNYTEALKITEPSKHVEKHIETYEMFSSVFGF